LFTLLNIRYGIAKQSKLYCRQVLPLIEDIQTSGLSANEQLLFKRMRAYAVDIAAYFGEVLCSLQGKKFTNELRYRFALLGACTPLFDGFFDEMQLKPERIQQLLDAESILEDANPVEKCFLHCYLPLKKSVSGNSFFNRMLQQMFEAQVLSQKQVSAELNTTDAEQITLAKGGSGAVLFLSLLEDTPDDTIYKAIYKIGGWVQLCDDVFDMERDQKEGILTLPLLINHSIKIKAKLQEYKEVALKSLHQSPYPALQISRTIKLLEFYDKLVNIYLKQVSTLNPIHHTEPLPHKLKVPDFKINAKVIFSLLFR
jgi:hypothetical protein